MGTAFEDQRDHLRACTSSHRTGQGFAQCSRWSSNAVPIYIYIFYIGDPTALWAFIATAWASFAASCLQAWAWIVANPGTTAVAVAVAVAIVAVGAKWFL